ncbi:mycofactocin precursor MftA [Streptomyces sp. NPDC055144]
MNEFDTVPAEENAPEGPVDHLIEADALIEEVSIDGMCGVY